MFNHVDTKVTIWNRYLFTDDTNMHDIVNVIEKEGTDAISEQPGFSHHLQILDSEEQLTPEDNGGEATIEVYEQGALKWKNAPAANMPAERPPLQLTDHEEKTLSSISDVDISYCLRVFESYQVNLTLINNLAAALDSKIQSTPTEEVNFFDEQMKGCHETLSRLAEIKKSLNKALIEKIEKHFLDRYKIKLRSFAADRQCTTEINSITTVIQPMLAQCGQDLKQAGRQNIITRFQEMFIYDEEQPTLQGNTICLPQYYTHNAFRSRGIVYLEKTEIPVTRLLDAICICFTPHNARPDSFDELHKEWQYEINIHKTYILLPQVALRFFRNGRINIHFPTEGQARNFWAFFDLTDIATRNQQKRNIA